MRTGHYSDTPRNYDVNSITPHDILCDILVVQLHMYIRVQFLSTYIYTVLSTSISSILLTSDVFLFGRGLCTTQSFDQCLMLQTDRQSERHLTHQVSTTTRHGVTLHSRSICFPTLSYSVCESPICRYAVGICGGL